MTMEEKIPILASAGNNITISISKNNTRSNNIIVNMAHCRKHINLKNNLIYITTNKFHTNRTVSFYSITTSITTSTATTPATELSPPDPYDQRGPSPMHSNDLSVSLLGINYSIVIFLGSTNGPRSAWLKLCNIWLELTKTRSMIVLLYIYLCKMEAHQ